jgi:hypothetical protein
MSKPNVQPSKPELTCLVGAGASIPFGVPSTADLTKAVIDALKNYDSRGDAPFQPRIEKLLAAAENYYAGNGLNFEHLLDLFEGIDALQGGWDQRNIPTVAEACVTKPRDEFGDVFDSTFINECIFSLVWTVLEAIKHASADAPGHERWPICQAFWRRLAEEFTLTVATLNYDTLIEEALGLDGSHQGMAPIPDENTWRLNHQSLVRHDRHRLFHLHGGIHFGRREYGTDPNRFIYDDSFHELYWSPVAPTSWGSARHSQSGRMLNDAPIVTGLHKPDKLLIEPFASYYFETAHQLTRSNRLLVIGYGFSDLHINALLERMNKIHGAARRVAIVDLVDLVWEHGSHKRSKMLTTLGKWAGEDRLDHRSGRSVNGRARWYWGGLPETAQQRMVELVRFLAE